MAYLVEHSTKGRVIHLSMHNYVGGVIARGTTTGATRLDADKAPSVMLVILISSIP